MKKTSQKIIMSAIIAIQSFTAIASPENIDFDIPKAEYIQTQKVNQEDNKEAEFSFQYLNKDKKISFEEMLLKEESGVFKNPFKAEEVMVISFQNKEDLRASHDEIKKDLEENGLLNFSTYEKYRDKELTKKYTKTGSFHSQPNADEIDYNFISYSKEQLIEIQKDAREKGYSEEMIELLPYAILFHEMGHTHNHQAKVYQDLQEQTKDFSKEEKKIRRKEIEEKLELMNLGGENYADSFMFMKIAEMEKEKNPENGLKNVNELSDYFIKHFRNDNEKQNEFDIHASKATVKTTIDFINNNWEIIDQFTHVNKEQLAASITNGTLNNPEINSSITSYSGQKELARDGGLSNSVIKSVSKKVNKEMQEMISLSIAENGDTAVSFNYKQHAHEYNNIQKYKM